MTFTGLFLSSKKTKTTSSGGYLLVNRRKESNTLLAYLKPTCSITVFSHH